MEFVQARNSALNIVESLLAGENLPHEDVPSSPGSFFLGYEGPSIVGCIGIEIGEKDALLRSLVVPKPHRRKGYGEMLFLKVLEHAKTRGVRNLYLLTTIAEDFFTRCGFSRIDRDKAPPFIRTSNEFRSLCPSSAALMHLIIKT